MEIANVFELEAHVVTTHMLSLVDWSSQDGHMVGSTALQAIDSLNSRLRLYNGPNCASPE